MPDELWTEVHDIVQETGIKTIPVEKKCKKAKWLSEEALHIAVKRRGEKSKGEKERYKHLNEEFHVLYSIFLLVIHFKSSSVYMFIANSQIIPCPYPSSLQP